MLFPKITKIILLLIAVIMIGFFIILLSGCEEKNNMAAELDKLMSAYNENCSYKYSGSILVAKGGEILLNKGYGMANYKEQIPNKLDSVFAIGSISKSFTAVAIMQLQEKQMLNINDPISKYIDGNKRGDDITIHHLLTHTSGLERNVLTLGPLAISLEKNINYINKGAMLFEPGEGYSYSNAGYVILAAIIEKVSGKTYNDYITDNIFKPLEMNNSSLGTDNSYVDNQSIGYEILIGEPKIMSLINFSSIIGCGNIYSTVEDLYKYDRALCSEKLLSKESLDQIFKPYLSNSSYGYGWGIAEKFGHKEISHNGHLEGYYSSMLRYPDDDYVLIFLTNNTDNTALDSISQIMTAFIFNEEYIIPQKLHVVEVDYKKLEEYSDGKYEFEGGLLVTIEYIGGKFHLKYDGGNDYELLPLSESIFYPKNYECSRVEFIFDENNKVVSLKIFENASVHEGIKVN